MAKTVILSEETIRNLIEAHASMAAWHYQMSDALHRAGVTAQAPSDEQRRARVAQVAMHYPEVATVAQTISAPRAFVPPPVIAAPAAVVQNEGVVVAPPPEDHLATPAMIDPVEPESAPKSSAPSSQPAPPSTLPKSVHPPEPPIVDPSKVKYD